MTLKSILASTSTIKADFEFSGKIEIDTRDLRRAGWKYKLQKWSVEEIRALNFDP